MTGLPADIQTDTPATKPFSPAIPVPSADEQDEFIDRFMLINEAAAHHKAGRHEIALQKYLKLAADPRCSKNVFYNIAVQLRALGRHQEALKPLTVYLAHVPNDARAWSNAGDSVRELGNNAAAIEMFRHALAIAPTMPEAKANTAAAHHNLSRELLGTNDMVGALEHAMAAAALDPTDPEIVTGLGEIQLMLGDFENGWKNYEMRPARGLAEAPRNTFSVVWKMDDNIPLDDN